MRLRLTSLAALGLALAIGGTSRAALITNGSFEDNSLLSATDLAKLNSQKYVITKSPIEGWYNPVSNAAGIEIQKNQLLGSGSTFNAHQGVQYIELNPDNASSIAQNVATTIGQKYELSFWYSARPNTPSGALNKAEVSFGGSVVNTFSAVPTTSGIVWQHITATVTASSTLTVLRFNALLPPGSYGTLIDDVSLKAVPEPASMAMCGTALLVGAGLVARRRKARVAQA